MATRSFAPKLFPRRFPERKCAAGLLGIIRHPDDMIPSLRSYLQSLGPFRVRTPLPKVIPGKVVLIRMDMIGDQVIFGGFIEEMAKAWPKTKIALVGRDNQQDIYQNCPWLAEYIPVDAHNSKSRTAAYRRIRQFKPDWIVNPMACRSLFSDRIMRYCYAPVRVGWKAPPHEQDYHRRLAFDKFYTHQFPQPDWPVWLLEREKNRLLLEHLGIQAGETPPLVWTSEEDVRFARDSYEGAGFRPEETAVCFLGASTSIKTAPHLKSYLARLSQEFNLNILMVGSERDRESSDVPPEVSAEKWRNLCGRTTVLQTAELMRAARIVIGVDSGPAHLAAAVQTPHVIAMHGMHFGRFLPANAFSSVIINPLSCYLCAGNCRFDHIYCLSSLPYELFHQAVSDALQKTSERARIYRPGGAFLNRIRPEVQPRWDPGWINPAASELITIEVD